jgi:polyisoprenoid-binding protein YceI
MTPIATQPTTTGTRWIVDTDRTVVEFAVKTFWGLATVRGRFDRFDGTYQVRPDDASIELTIDADSLDTGNAKRDKHLRSADFFHVGDHPIVRFASVRVRHVDGGVLHVEGALDVAGTVVPLEFDATMRQVGRDLEVEAATEVDPGSFGMTRGHLAMIRPPARLHVKARLRRPLSSDDHAVQSPRRPAGGPSVYQRWQSE